MAEAGGETAQPMSMLSTADFASDARSLSALGGAASSSSYYFPAYVCPHTLSSLSAAQTEGEGVRTDKGAEAIAQPPPTLSACATALANASTFGLLLQVPASPIGLPLLEREVSARPPSPAPLPPALFSIASVALHHALLTEKDAVWEARAVM